MEFLIPCKIGRGGFTSERTFEISQGSIVGTAYFEHLLDADRNPLQSDVPPHGATIDGFSKCRFLRQVEDDLALIELPSAEVVSVPSEHLLRRA